MQSNKKNMEAFTQETHEQGRCHTMSLRVLHNATSLARYSCATTALAQSTTHHSRQLSQAPATSAGIETTLVEYADRRQRFLQHLPPHSVVLLPAADECIASHDILRPHRQDSLWYHLFGLHTPLRRQLDPPSRTLTEDVRATMAILARLADDSTHTILCVPPPTVDPATLLWASERTPMTTFAEMLDTPEQEKRDGAASTAAVIANDVPAIHGALCGLIARMAARQLEQEEHAAQHSEGAHVQPSTAEERIARDRGALLRIMPHLFAAYPQQLRWDGRRYRLPQSAQQREQQSRSKKAAPTYHHPLEAFFDGLHSTEFAVQLPRPLFEDTTHAPWDSVAFQYKAASAYTPGLVPLGAAAAGTAMTEVHIAAPAPPHPRALDVPVSASTRGTVRLPIRRSDAHMWSYRLVKGPSQLRQHLISARATEHAFTALMCDSATASSEHDLQCSFQRSLCECSAHFGAAARVRSAYIPVIASGVHGTEIHYTDNCAVAVAGDAVRVDAGVEVAQVPTDCTRTFPIGSHRFASSAVERLYDGLLGVQRSLLRHIAPGVAVADVARRHLDETRLLLCSLGVDLRVGESPPAQQASLLSGDAEWEGQLPMSLVRSCFCAHSFGHLFGLDIHEEWGGASATSTPPPHVFEGGMMHTVEPGVYMPCLQRAGLFGLTAAHLPAAFHGGVGLQIEDDVLVLPAAADTASRTGVGSREASVPCPWSRGVYLQHALAAFARYYGGANACRTKDPQPSLQSPSLAVEWCRERVRGLLDAGTIATAPSTPHEWNVVCFLFSQRVAMDGFEVAAAALPGDVATAHKLFFVAGPAYGKELATLVPDAATTEWYPFSILVLTATVPKDRLQIEALMRQSNGHALRHL